MVSSFLFFSLFLQPFCRYLLDVSLPRSFDKFLSSSSRRIALSLFSQCAVTRAKLSRCRVTKCSISVSKYVLTYAQGGSKVAPHILGRPCSAQQQIIKHTIILKLRKVLMHCISKQLDR